MRPVDRSRPFIIRRPTLIWATMDVVAASFDSPNHDCKSSAYYHKVMERMSFLLTRSPGEDARHRGRIVLLLVAAVRRGAERSTVGMRPKRCYRWGVWVQLARIRGRMPIWNCCYRFFCISPADEAK